MAVALTLGIIIRQADQPGDAVFVDSVLNGFGEVAEARMVFCVRYRFTGVYSARRKDPFHKQFKKSLISFCNSLELVALSDSSESAKDETLLLK